MRMMLKAVMDTETGNEAIRSGALPKVLEQIMQQLKPEAAYFYPDNGKRTMLMVFDMEHPSQIPPTLEPLFQGAEATVQLTPVMTAEDLMRGVQEAHG